MSHAGSERLISLLHQIPMHQRGETLQAAASFRPRQSLDSDFRLGPVRAAFSDYWEQWFQEPTPIVGLRTILTPPIPMDTILEFTGLSSADTEDELGFILTLILKYLRYEVRKLLSRSQQLCLFDGNGESKELP
jgi:hypothetical protein